VKKYAIILSSSRGKSTEIRKKDRTVLGDELALDCPGGEVAAEPKVYARAQRKDPYGNTVQKSQGSLLRRGGRKRHIACVAADGKGCPGDGAQR